MDKNRHVAKGSWDLLLELKDAEGILMKFYWLISYWKISEMKEEEVEPLMEDWFEWRFYDQKIRIDSRNWLINWRIRIRKFKIEKIKLEGRLRKFLVSCDLNKVIGWDGDGAHELQRTENKLKTKWSRIKIS